jgi:hypothetical protein
LSQLKTWNSSTIEPEGHRRTARPQGANPQPSNQASDLIETRVKSHRYREEDLNTNRRELESTSTSSNNSFLNHSQKAACFFQVNAKQTTQSTASDNTTGTQEEYSKSFEISKPACRGDWITGFRTMPEKTIISLE